MNLWIVTYRDIVLDHDISYRIMIVWSIDARSCVVCHRVAHLRFDDRVTPHSRPNRLVQRCVMQHSETHRDIVQRCAMMHVLERTKFPHKFPIVLKYQNVI